MRLTYETGTATIIQLIILSFFNIANTVESILANCFHTGGQCATNVFSSVAFYIATVLWFAFLAFLGYLAQTRRNKKFALMVMAAEMAVFIFAAANVYLGITYHNAVLGLFTSLIDLILSSWIITLAYRLYKAGSSRVVHARRRRHSVESDT
ncbi:MAG TPA: hypothetical protein VFN51_02305 [Candidatus Saccharimonadales bacterium]|nr:hypothetical protein [Candidatus Saccharimonadales bacterium]